MAISSSLFCSVHRSAILGQINEDGDIWNMCRRRKVDLFLIALPSERDSVSERGGSSNPWPELTTNEGVEQAPTDINDSHQCTYSLPGPLFPVTTQILALFEKCFLGSYSLHLPVYRTCSTPRNVPTQGWSTGTAKFGIIVAQKRMSVSFSGWDKPCPGLPFLLGERI